MSRLERTQRRAERTTTLNLLRNLTLREIRAQYKRTALGRVWSLINPLAQIAVYSIVFGLLIQIPVAPGSNSGLELFPIWIGVGVIAWGYISGAISAGMGSMLANAGLLTKVYFPRSVLPVSAVLSSTFTFGTELLVLLAIMVLVGGPMVLLYAPLLVPLLALTLAFVMGIAMLLSVASIYFRDIQHLWSIFSQMWMYASGVMFSVELVRGAEERLASQYGLDLPLVTLFQLNPAERFLEAYRNILYDFAVPSWDIWLTLLCWSVGSLIVGKLVFDRLARNIVEEI
ncbi:ABC transporter permease [Agrococcus sp. TF02-05]|uniref:ABC transporter permease n=1 Tax=Agrococcus sp. TF02-05 TaxID=2815211 RepID=UPI001AA1C391|nr:ABC transporter permease [Agrococcus sp. TF02-05]MBO1770699.1 ABC transporter permease [Agrococcus sp. TF02-05]